MDKDQFGRAFNAARQAQGFRDQAHLDAFYAHFDHVKGCSDCHEGSVLMDDGWQGVLVECAEAQRLYLAERGA